MPGIQSKVPRPLPKPPPRLAAGSRLHGLEPSQLVKLHHSLAEALDFEQGVIAQFVAPEPDAVVEAVVYDLAYISSAWLNKRVLFINGVGMRFDMNEYVGLRPEEPVPVGRTNLGDIENNISRVVGLDLYQMTFPNIRGALGLTPALRRMPEFLDRLRGAFDLVVIASPPASAAPMGVLLSRFVDGNILVLEAGRTRAPVAAELRNSISASGGAILGVVLTRYRSYVPRFLRDWM
jgi:Mrp family chromosome partitioning ATPase